MKQGFVYAYVQKNKVLYIGRTKNLRQRILTHRSDLPVDCDVYAALTDDMVTAEGVYIARIDPPLNKTHGRIGDERNPIIFPWFYVCHVAKHKTIYSKNDDWWTYERSAKYAQEGGCSCALAVFVNTFSASAAKKGRRLYEPEIQISTR